MHLDHPFTGIRNPSDTRPAGDRETPSASPLARPGVITMPGGHTPAGPEPAAPTAGIGADGGHEHDVHPGHHLAGPYIRRAAAYPLHAVAAGGPRLRRVLPSPWSVAPQGTTSRRRGIGGRP